MASKKTERFVAGLSLFLVENAKGVPVSDAMVALLHAAATLHIRLKGCQFNMEEVEARVIAACKAWDGGAN